MAKSLTLLLGLLGELFLQSLSISLRRNAGDSYSDYLDASEDDPSLVGADCRDPAIGDKCFNAVKWSLERGVRDHPEWYPEFHGAGLTEDNFREMQLLLHNEGKAGCAKPCPPFFTPYATLGSVTEPTNIEPPNRNTGEAQETETKPSPADDTSPGAELKKEIDEINAPHGDISDMSLDSFSKFLNDPKWRDAMAATITTTVEETTSILEEAVTETTPVAAAEEAQPNNTEAAEAPAADREVTVQEKIDTLKAELEALESMDSSPAIDAMRQEKREQLQSLQATLPAEEAPAATEPAEEGAPAPAGDAAEPAGADAQNSTADAAPAEVPAQNSTADAAPAAEDSQNSTAEEAPAVIDPIEEGAPAQTGDAAEPAAEACHTAVEGEDCYAEVLYSKHTGVLKHPERYDGLSTDSPFEAFQRYVHGLSTVCPVPCALGAEPAGTDSQNSTADAAPAEEQAAAAPAAEDSQNSTADAAPAAEDPGCRTSVEGDACYDEVIYSKRTGVVKHPDKYVGLTPDSPFEDFQRHVHSVSNVCPEPCAPKNPLLPAAAEPAASTDSQSDAAVAAVPPAAEQPKGIKGWFSRFRKGAKKEAKKELAAADEPPAEARKFAAAERVEQKLAAQSDAAEMEAAINKKEAEMMAQEAQARVDRMEEEAKMKGQVARQQAKEEAEMDEARRDMMSERAEARKVNQEAE